MQGRCTPSHQSNGTMEGGARPREPPQQKRSDLLFSVSIERRDLQNASVFAFCLVDGHYDQVDNLRQDSCITDVIYANLVW